MAGHVFINYRRSANLKDAQLLQNVLHRSFGKSRVFLDVSGLDGGDHWLHSLERQVDASAAMVTLIGKGWADVQDEHGHRRLDNPNDFVRFEIARAFTRSIPVLPVLIDGATMPPIAQLPSNLVPLSFPQAMLLRSETLDDDGEKIARRLKQLIAAAVPRGLPVWQTAVAVVAALMLGITTGPYLLMTAGFPVRWGSNTELERKVELAETARKTAEAQSGEERQARIKAEANTQRQVAEMSVLRERIQALTAQAEAQKNAAAQALAREKAATDIVAAKERELAALKPPETPGAKQLGLSLTTSISPTGVRITSIAPLSEAWQKGLQEGDLILQAGGLNVFGPGDVENAIQVAIGMQLGKVQLRVRSGTVARSVQLQLLFPSPLLLPRLE